MVKKNYHGGLKLLLSLLFIMLLGMSSTCFAFTNDYIKFTLDSISSDTSNNLTTSELDFLNNYKNNSSNISSIVSLLNTYSNLYNLPTNDRNLICFIYKPNSSTKFQIVYIVSNCGFASTSVGFLDLRNNSTNILRPYSLNGSCLGVRYTFTGSSFNTSQDTNINNYYITSTGYSYFNNSDSVITLNNCYNYMPTQSIYYSPLNKYVLINNNNFTYTNTLTPDEPEEPSGDSPSGDSGDSEGNGGGFIDYTNKLNDINNNISNSSSNIIQNNNENTEKIINSISGETNKIINNITNTDTDVNVSGELSNMLSSTDNIVDPTINFFSWLLDNIRTVLNSTGDYDLNITLFNETYTIRSDFFKLPDGDLKTFLQSSFLAWFGWRIIKKIRYIVYAIKCVNISSALNSVDFNPDIL